MSDPNLSRRRLLAATVATGTMGAIAGCGGGDQPEGGPEDEPGMGNGTETDGEGGGDGGDDTPTEGGGDEGDTGADEDPQARMVSYLEAEPQARAYGGGVQDATDGDEVTVQVGAGENGLAFDPPGMRISSGTTVIWEWTGEGGAHNVASTTESDHDLEGGDSDFDFYSGEPQEDGTYEETFDETGVGLYMCEPHAQSGMKGGFVVEE